MRSHNLFWAMHTITAKALHKTGVKRYAGIARRPSKGRRSHKIIWAFRIGMAKALSRTSARRISGIPLPKQTAMKQRLIICVMSIGTIIYHKLKFAPPIKKPHGVWKPLTTAYWQAKSKRSNHDVLSMRINRLLNGVFLPRGTHSEPNIES